MAGRRKTGRVSPADRHAGLMLRRLRLTAGRTQQELAELVGVSYQQIHKYESGQNRLTVGWVATFATALGCRPDDFFADETPASAAVTAPARRDLELARRVLAMAPGRRRALVHFLDAFSPAAPGAMRT